jgi:hypothetical protein
MATCKEMLVTPVNKAVDKKRKIGKRRTEEDQGGPRRRRGTDLFIGHWP